MARTKKSTKKSSIIARTLDNLSEMGITCRPMFGCFGLYSNGTFFGIICDDQLFLRTDQTSRKKFIAEGMPYLEISEKQKEHNYYQVPDSVLDSKAKLNLWAREAVEVQKKRTGSKR